MFAFAHFKNQQSLFGNRQSKPADFVLKLAPFLLARISHTLFRYDLLRPILPAFRSIFLWTVCTHTARQQNQRAPWQNGARGVSRRKVYEKCGLMEMRAKPVAAFAKTRGG